ncbi:hypothetical protein OH807_18435 [Kitasatospora sp. NBC_01560]|uniref:hypothetical protein n=1 Tax=Kitasatospora sp. NBC_01560 TaxID=2975965 RepID=UPI003867AB83
MPAAAYRYFTTDALTGEILAHDLPLSGVEFGPELNGPGAMRGLLAPRYAHLGPSQAEAGTVLLWAERDQRLSWGGLIWRAKPEGDELPLEAAGFSSYPGSRHDLHGNLNGRGPYAGVDPCRIIADTWAYLQEQPDGDLGVSVDLPPDGCPARLGDAEHPYAIKEWETTPLSGPIRDATALENGPEWTETVAWVGQRPDRRITVAWPRLGTRREDLLFASGINIARTTPITSSADDYAQVILALGAGEGSARVRSVDAVRNGRLRLEHVLDRPSVTDPTTLAQLARAERASRQQISQVDEITVVDHPAAPIGSWAVGDDVQVSVHDQWTSFDGWCRVVGWTLRPAEGDRPETATLRLTRAYTTGA